MRHLRLLSVITVLLTIDASSPSARVDTVDTKLLTQPAVSATHLAFIYAGDLFVADFAGSGNPANVRRLTTDDGVESNPVFSPDGRTFFLNQQGERQVPDESDVIVAQAVTYAITGPFNKRTRRNGR